jgi:ATP-dependent Lhr-like helicase
MDGGAPDAEAWFASRGWRPFAFQREVWVAMAHGRSGLLHATTGSGKTYAVWLGALARSPPLDRANLRSEGAGPDGGAPGSAGTATALQVLWLTPIHSRWR